MAHEAELSSSEFEESEEDKVKTSRKPGRPKRNASKAAKHTTKGNPTKRK